MVGEGLETEVEIAHIQSRSYWSYLVSREFTA
jgi:hypothetical protein